jgi:hypothetical protein
MNTEKTPSPSFENTALAGETAASAYLAEQLPKARQTLRRTRVLGVILICFVGAYIGVISTIMVKFFQPQAAAQVASGMLIEHAKSEGPALAAQFEKEVLTLLRGVPDYLISEMPNYRKTLQESLEKEYELYCSSLGKDLGDQIDKLIDDHKAEIKTLLENANDRETIRKVLPDFDRVIADFTQADVDGRVLKKQIDELAMALKEVEKRMDRLANASDLTPEEQRARRALAMLAKVIEDNTKMPEGASVPAKKPLR